MILDVIFTNCIDIKLFICFTVNRALHNLYFVFSMLRNLRARYIKCNKRPLKYHDVKECEEVTK